MFEFIIANDKINLDYEMKMLTEFNFNNVMNINNKLIDFYSNANKRIFNIERLINESINSKS